ncbi:MAG: hypothetical protein ACTSX6_08115 [Candidatus Heimdallarchaeaceae archaeon]
MKTYIGIDNGVTGSITIINEENILHIKTPVKKELNYTKNKQNISRINHTTFREFLKNNIDVENKLGNFVLLERPMVNPTRFRATQSALRALEAVLIVLEDLQLSFQYVDSKEWQKMFLPGVKGNALKKAAVDVAKRLYPHVETKDADSILIAEYARRRNL